MGAGLTASLCQQCSRNAAKNISQPWGCSQAQGASIAAGRGGLTLRARRDAGTTSQSREDGGRVNRRAPDPWGRCGGLSGAGSAADAGLARPNHAESALAPACRASGASTCWLGPNRGGGSACPA